MINKVAIVTGANKGIGFAIVRELCRRGVKTVYLTARDEGRGTSAVNDLRKEGYNPIFHQLEVTDEDSVKKFADHIRKEHGGIDILINNAAVAPEKFAETTVEDAKRVIDVNFYSILTIQKYLFNLLNDNARVVNVSSDLGHLSRIKNEYWIKKLAREDLLLSDIEDFINWFLDSVKSDTFKVEFVFPYVFSYIVSKIAVCAYTRIQQREAGRGISINSLHPGFVKTSMTRQSGLLTVEEASEAPVYLVLDADQSLKGKYIWFDKTEVDWTDSTLTFDYIDPDTFKEFIVKMSA